MQSDAFDFIALAVGIVATLRPAATELFPVRRLPTLCSAYNCFALMLTVLLISVSYAGVFGALNHQSWYSGGNGGDAQVMLELA